MISFKIVLFISLKNNNNNFRDCNKNVKSMREEKLKKKKTIENRQRRIKQLIFRYINNNIDT